MKKVLNYGSMNIDHVYKVSEFVSPGQTIHSQDYEIFSGGKGLNQSIALAHYGADTYHGGNLGPNSDFLLDTLKEAGVKTQYITIGQRPSGHAIIQVDQKGENCIILFGGSNLNICQDDIKNTLANFQEGDILLIQNETNNLSFMIKEAKKRNMTVFFNPAPFDSAVLSLPLEMVDCLIVNETEGQGLTGKNSPKDILDLALKTFPNTAILLTLGSQGAIYANKELRLNVSAYKLGEVVDTTAAGDTFIGYFVGAFSKDKPLQEALELAAKAAGLAVTKEGAAPSIPWLHDLNI